MNLSDTRTYRGAKIQVFTQRLHSRSYSYVVYVDGKQIDVAIDGELEQSAIQQAIAAATKFIDARPA
jgi:hypothetical protein